MKKHNLTFKFVYSSYDELKAIFNFVCNLTDFLDCFLSVMDDELKAMERGENE